MRFDQRWKGRALKSDGSVSEWFPASVPGNIQYDYGVAHGFLDVQFADQYKQYLALEDDSWEYSAVLDYVKGRGERVFFVSGGIDYKYDILLGNELLYSYEGMYKPVELDLTDRLKGEGEVLTVRIHPHPKRSDAPKGTRSEADESCKPPVCYGWDWNPRLLISGMWQESYIETRDESYIGNCEVRTSLDADLKKGTLTFDFECKLPCQTALYDAQGNTVYQGSERRITVDSPELWWCNGQGTPYLYRWVIRNEREERTGTVGFRRIRLVKNTNAKDPSGFPKSRYAAPATVELNGRRIMAKGSNWVNPELFWGRIDQKRYEELILLARDANMNMFRMWGGAAVAKASFYELCDKYGILVWQEFMLACNLYQDGEPYMSVLESEATAIIKSLRSHPCLAMWCGGNELFNGWSGMDDQSHPLRLLNKLCYEYDYPTPYLPTSPLIGMAHGGYKFYSQSQGGDVFCEFQRSHNTAYTEFGVPSVASVELLKQIIPEDQLFPIEKTDAWVAHHGFDAWGESAWLCLDILEQYFGKPDSLEAVVNQSNWLQSAGYQAAFEEMRKQWPHCAMMLNWCYNEPWITAANNSILSYPASPKPAYRSVQSALRPQLFSARIPKFAWKSGEVFEAEIWLLNDTAMPVSADVSIRLRIGEQILPLLHWSASAEASANVQGPTVRQILPEADTDRIELLLEAGELSSTYCLRYQQRRSKVLKIRTMNM